MLTVLYFLHEGHVDKCDYVKELEKELKNSGLKIFPNSDDSHYNLGGFPKELGKVRTYIWTGFQNGYGHPSGTVLNMIKAEGYGCNWITEKTSMPIVRHETWFIK